MKIRFIINTLFFYAMFICIYLLVTWVFENQFSFTSRSIPSDAIIFEPLFLFLTFSTLVLLTARIKWSFLITCVWYVFLLFANKEKVDNLLIPVMPRDVIYLNELFNAKEALASYWLTLAVLIVISAFLVWFFIKDKKHHFLAKKLSLIRFSVLSMIILFGVFKNDISHFITKKHIHLVNSSQLASAFNNGFLTYFYQRIIAYKSLDEPSNYSKELMTSLAESYNTKQINSVAPDVKPNVIIFFIEAFADPLKSGFEFTFDPIPNFHSAQSNNLSGNLLSPVVGGLSANAEFELLTGLNMDFIPHGSIPYIDSITQPIPSLASVFKLAGYDTHALHVATLSFFNYKQVYPLTGFDSHFTLLGNQKYKMDPANRYPDESELVKEIINLTEDQNPQFIFSFPNSTHGFWDYDAFLESDLTITNFNNTDQQNELKTYVNALHHADKAIGELLAHYTDFDEPTVVLIAGDHLAGLPAYRIRKVINDLGILNADFKLPESPKEQRKLYRKLRAENPDLYNKSLHEVPFVLWSNYHSFGEKINTEMFLVNHLIRNLINTDNQPLFNLISQIYQEEANKNINSLSLLMTDYQIFQYDLLYGNQYYMEWLANNSVSN